MTRFLLTPFLIVATVLSPLTAAFSTPNQAASIQSLLSDLQPRIAKLKDVTAKVLPSDADADTIITNDVFYLRYLLEEQYDTDDERAEALKATLEWRTGEGKAIVDSAREASEAAMSEGGWNNDPVRNAAPHASLINTHITPAQCITTTSNAGDLIYCIRAGKIDDAALMSSVSIDQMVDFFLYCKEVNAAMADRRSLELNKLVKIVSLNDLSGVKLIGGSSDFRNSLSAASKRANDLYPSLNGITLLLNLPRLLGALVKLFTPLFPAAVRERLRFERGPLKDVEDLREIIVGGEKRDEFMKQIDELVY